MPLPVSGWNVAVVLLIAGALSTTSYLCQPLTATCFASVWERAAYAIQSQAAFSELVGVVSKWSKALEIII